MITQKQAINIAQKYAGAIEQSGINVEHLFLFGSYSRNAQHKWSDLDIAVVSKNFGVDRMQERVNLMMLTHKPELEDIEPHPIGLEDFEAGFDPFVKEVKMGIKIV